MEGIILQVMVMVRMAIVQPIQIVTMIKIKILLTGLQVLRDGRIEAMVTILKTRIMKMAEAEGEEELQMI